MVNIGAGIGRFLWPIREKIVNHDQVDEIEKLAISIAGFQWWNGEFKVHVHVDVKPKIYQDAVIEYLALDLETVKKQY